MTRRKKTKGRRKVYCYQCAYAFSIASKDSPGEQEPVCLKRSQVTNGIVLPAIDVVGIRSPFIANKNNACKDYKRRGLFTNLIIFLRLKPIIDIIERKSFIITHGVNANGGSVNDYEKQVIKNTKKYNVSRQVESKKQVCQRANTDEGIDGKQNVITEVGSKEYEISPTGNTGA